MQYPLLGFPQTGIGPRSRYWMLTTVNAGKRTRRVVVSADPGSSLRH